MAKQQTCNVKLETCAEEPTFTVKLGKLWTPSKTPNGSCLNDTGISFQILAPTLENALFWISNLDFLVSTLFDELDRVLQEWILVVSLN